jgi:predicted RNase H-like HicB family nuclease
MPQYIALIHKDPDSEYRVLFPDLPGCPTAGATLDEARDMAAEALAFHLEGMQEDEEPVPEPSSLETIMADQENRGGVAILVPPPERPVQIVRINVILPADMLAKIDRYAEEHGYTRFGFLAAAAKKAIATT